MAEFAPSDPDSTEFREGLTSWMAGRLNLSKLAIHGVTAPKSGYSAETMIVDCGPDGKFVLRRESPDPAVYPVQAPGLDVEIEIQWRVMQAVAQHSAVPVAPLIGYEADPEILGAPFFVMGFVDGEVPVENPPYAMAGFFFDASPTQRRQLIERGIGTLAALHELDWQAAGLQWLDVPGEQAGSARQFRLWTEYTQRELDGRAHPVLERGLDWLSDTIPETSPVGLSWGDGRPGNIIWRNFEVACVTDFEAASLAPPEHDLGWWLLFDRWSHEAMGAPRLDGEPTREEQRDRYYELISRDLGDTRWHEAFAAARYAAIVVRVMNRMVARGQMPAEATYWRENQAVDCLAALIDD